MMSFKKNLFTIVVAIILVLMGTWLVGIPRNAVINGMTLVIATMVMTLMLEDFWRKVLSDSALVTWQYILGMLFVSGSVLGWLWASESVTTKEMVVRLSATFLVAIASGLIFYGPYRVSVGNGPTEEDAETVAQKKLEKKFDRWRGKIAKSDAVDALEILRDRLAFALVGDTLGGDLDFQRPLGMVDGEPVSYNKLRDAGHPDGKLDEIDTYLKHLINNR